MAKNSFKVKKSLEITPVDPTTLVDPSVGDIIVDSTDSNKLKKYDGVSFEEITGSGGGGGGFNYIENGTAETDTTGYTVYKNTTVGTSPDDFGGTPSGNLTFTRNTTTPLVGVADFKLSKTAANLQGEGVYYEFTAENGHLATKLLLQITSDVSALDDGDLRIYLVSSSDDFVADFNIISANNPDVLGGLTKIHKQFQLDATDTKYRLCLHYASTDTVAKDAYFDEIELGPKSVATSAVVTDFQEFTPTGSWTTNTTYTGQYRRVGDVAEIQYNISLSGAPTATTLILDMPSGLTIDSDKLENGSQARQIIGQGVMRDAGTRSYAATVQYESDTSVTPLTFLDTGSYEQNSIVNATTPYTFTSSDELIFNIKVPIQGWSSNAVTSEDLGGREIIVEGAGNGGTSLTGNVTDVDFTEVRDTTSSWDGTTFTAPESGDYLISGSVSFNAAVTLAPELYVNGSLHKRIGSVIINTTQGHFSSGVYLEKGDVASIRVDTSATLSNATEPTIRHHIHIQKLASPQTILETETVFARASSNNGQTLTNSTDDRIVFEDLETDTHNAYDNSTGIYTAPVSGIYTISTIAGPTTAAVEAGEIYRLRIRKNLVTLIRYSHEFDDPNSGNAQTMSITTTVQLEKGDEIDVTFFHNTGSNITLSTSSGVNVFTIIRNK